MLDPMCNVWGVNGIPLALPYHSQKLILNRVSIFLLLILFVMLDYREMVLKMTSEVDESSAQLSLKETLACMSSSGNHGQTRLISTSMDLEMILTIHVAS